VNALENILILRLHARQAYIEMVLEGRARGLVPVEVGQARDGEKESRVRREIAVPNEIDMFEKLG